MFVPLSSQVYVPIHMVERILFWNDSATVRLVGARDPEVLKGEDAQKLRLFIESSLPEPRKGKKC